MQSDQSPLLAKLLYPVGQAEPDLVQFGARLNDALTNTGLRLRPEGRDAYGRLVFDHPRAHLILTYHPVPCPPDTLAVAQAAPILSLKPGDTAALAATHGAYLSVEVHPGPANPAETPDGSPAPASWQLRLVILHRAVLALFDLTEPDLLFWPMSDMLFRREEVMATRDMTLPLPLCLHPLPIAGESAPDDAAPRLGFVAQGSERFCGKLVVLSPSAMPLSQGIAMVAALLRDHAGGITELADGATLRSPAHGGLFLRHTPPDEGASNGRILIGLGDWPDPALAHAIPLIGPRYTARDARYQSIGPEKTMIARAVSMALTPNGLMIMLGLVCYIAVSHFINSWIEEQDRIIRTSLESHMPKTPLTQTKP